MCGRALDGMTTGRLLVRRRTSRKSRQAAANLLTRDDGPCIAANTAKLPESAAAFPLGSLRVSYTQPPSTTKF
jgi:hypothetical protein